MVNVKVGVNNHGIFSVMGAAIIENIESTGSDEPMEVDLEEKGSKTLTKSAGGKKDSGRGGPSAAEKGKKSASHWTAVENELDGVDFADDNASIRYIFSSIL